MDLHPSAFKHGCRADDVVHAVRHAVVIEDLDDDLRLHLGAGTDGTMLEVITILRDGDRGELAIHAMAMRAKYRRLMPRE